MPRKKSPDTSSENDTSSAVMTVDPLLNSGAHADEIGYEAMIPLEQIHPSPDNPRRWFDEAELQSLADSLLKHGQLQNLTVRPLDEGNYELIGGERRFRAAAIAHMKAVRCRVILVPDATAIELRGIENYRRSQLNAIEEAIWFDQMLKTGRFNQTTLAQHLNITQSQVSNRLRLLKLPEEWQLLLVKGLLPPTHARSLIPWIDRPAVLAEVMTRITEKDGTIEEIAVNDLNQAIWSIISRCSRPMSVETWDGPRFELTDELRKELDIQSCTVPWADEPYDRAFNVELFDRLQEEAKAARKAAQDVESSDDDDGPLPNPDKVKTKDRSDLSDYRLEQHFERHFAQFLASRIKPDQTTIWIYFQTLVYNDGSGFLDWLTKATGLRDDDMRGWDEQMCWKAVQSLTPKNLVAQLAKYLQETWAEGHTDLDLPFMQRIADQLSVNPLAKWVPDAELLDLCSDRQLREFFTDEMASPKSVAKWGRERMLKEAINHWPPGYVPVLLMPKALLPDSEASDTDNDEADDEE